MRATTLFHVAALTCVAITGLAVPLGSSPSPLTAPGLVLGSSTAPVAAGENSFLDRRSLQADWTSLEPRVDGLVRVNMGTSKVYILMVVTSQVFGNIAVENIINTLQAAYSRILTLEREFGEHALVRQGFFAWGNSPRVTMWNANNHQMTNQVVAYAINGVMRYCHENSKYGAVDFQIFDGDNKVGEGVVSAS